MFCGHANPAIVAAVQAQAARSTQFLLPSQVSVEVAEELARRYPVPQWQFTLSATQANTEAIRLARAVTGREMIVLFQGHYHGHFEEGLVGSPGRPRPRRVQRGLSTRGPPAGVRIAQSTTPARCGRTLNPAIVALVLTEPAMTNTIHLLLWPEQGWHEDLRRLTRRHGTLLGIDGNPHHVVGPGGATAMCHLDPDIVTIGKAGRRTACRWEPTASPAELGEQLAVARKRRHRRHPVRQPAVGSGREGSTDPGAAPLAPTHTPPPSVAELARRDRSPLSARPACRGQ